MIFPNSAYRLVNKFQPTWKMGNFPYPVTQYQLPACLGPSALQTGTGTALIFFFFPHSFLFNGWFSAFLFSCMEELGLPPCSSCNTSCKVIYLAKLTVSFKISVHPSIIVGYNSYNSSWLTLPRTQLNKVLGG